MDIISTVPLHIGRKMPILGLGTWQLNTDTANTIAKALQLGYRMVDTSSDYGTQPAVGEAIMKSVIDRRQIFVVAKVEETYDAHAATKEYLKEIGLEYVDLMLIHRPPPSSAGEDLWQGLMHARDEGLTKDIGVSNYSTEQVQGLIDDSGEAPAVNQIEWSPFGHSADMMEYCNGNGIVIQAYSPLTRSERLDDDLLNSLAAKYSKSPAQLLIRWNLQIGTVPIVKANQPQHLKENLNVFDFEISDDDMAALSGLNEDYSSVGQQPLYEK